MRDGSSDDDKETAANAPLADEPEETEEEELADKPAKENNEEAGAESEELADDPEEEEDADNEFDEDDDADGISGEVLSWRQLWRNCKASALCRESSSSWRLVSARSNNTNCLASSSAGSAENKCDQI